MAGGITTLLQAQGGIVWREPCTLLQAQDGAIRDAQDGIVRPAPLFVVLTAAEGSYRYARGPKNFE
jgi:hypothetical protein